jgi:hypothetical protein
MEETEVIYGIEFKCERDIYSPIIIDIKLIKGSKGKYIQVFSWLEVSKYDFSSIDLKTFIPEYFEYLLPCIYEKIDLKYRDEIIHYLIDYLTPVVNVKSSNILALYYIYRKLKENKIFTRFYTQKYNQELKFDDLRKTENLVKIYNDGKL